MQPTMPKLLTILGIGAVVAVASIYIPRLKNSPRKQTEADPAEVESLFRAARDPSQTAQFQTLHSKTKKYSPRDAFGKTVFCAAAESFHFAAVRFLVSTETGSLVDSLLFTSSDESGSNVIHLLVANITKENWKDTVAMIKLLLAANTILCLSMGKAKNAVTGKTALMMAVEKCRETPDAFEVVKLLVKLHANVDSTDLDGKTALMLACLSQSTDAVAVWLLQSTPCDFRVLDSGNRSAVFYAIQSECREAAVLLVDRCRAVIKSPASLSSLNSLKRRNTNSSTVSSSSSLISTNTRETKVTIDPLIVADNLDGMTPLLLAIRLGDMALVNLLWSSSSKSDAMLKPLDLASNYPLRLAVLSGSLEIVMWVMENDKASDFTQPDELGTTPFHLAAQLHLPEILSFFLSCLKKNWNFGTCINDNAQTPLHVACDLGVSSVTSDSQHNPQNYVETIRILVKNGSPVSRAMIDDAGLTPLAYYKQSPIRNDALIHKEILGLLAPEPGYNFHENSVNGKSRLQRQILRIPVEVRRRQGLKANVSVEGFVKFLERISEAKKSGSIVGGVCVILGERAFPRRSDGAQYGGNRVSITDALLSPAQFYSSLSKTYSPLIATKLSTPLVHSLLLHLESQHILANVFTTTVEGLVPTLELSPPAVELYGNLNKPEPKCLYCSASLSTQKRSPPQNQQQQQQQTQSQPTQQTQEEQDKFWTTILPTYIRQTHNSSAKAKSTIPCPRIGCTKGHLAPPIFYKAQDLDSWVSRTLKGWHTIMKGCESWESVVLVGVQEDEEEIVKRILSRVADCGAKKHIPILVIDTVGESSKMESCTVEEMARIVEGGEEFRRVHLVVREEDGGVEEGLRRMAALAGWRW